MTQTPLQRLKQDAIALIFGIVLFFVSVGLGALVIGFSLGRISKEFKLR